MTKTTKTKATTEQETEVRLGRVKFDIKPGEDISADVCYLCGKPATDWPHPTKGTAHGFASITGHPKALLLCQACFDAEGNLHAIARKHFNNPDVEIRYFH